MPRNVKTHAYITLGFPRDLQAWQALQHEARERDMSVPRLIKLILVDRYQASHGQRQEEPAARKAVHRQASSTRTVVTETSAEAHTITNNAVAAAAFWGEDA